MNYKDKLKDPIFKIVSDQSKKLNISTFIVGGWVRDMLLKRKNNNDLDFVCLGDGILLAKEVSSALGKNANFKVFKNFGTASVSFNKKNYEFVGARKESYRIYSRKPIVQNGTLQDDQNRRDFTINAMSIQLTDEKFGEFIDPFNGLKDLNNKIIRTPLDPDITYSDDPLRMMRAIRFATQLNFSIDIESLESIKKNCKRLSIISQERITEELNKIISCDKPSNGFNLLYQTNLLNEFFPEMTQLKGVDYIEGKGHKDNFIHTLQVLDNICYVSDDLWLRWAAILHDIAKPITKKYDKINGWTFHGHEYIGSKMVPKIFKKLRLPLNSKMRFVKKMVKLHLRPIALAKDTVTDSAIRRLLFEAGEDTEKLMKLCDADITSKNPIKVRSFLNNFKLVRRKLIEVEEKDRIRNFQPPLNGLEIMEIFNISAGRKIGILKDALKEAILDGKIKNDRKEAEDFIIKKGSEIGLNHRK